MVAEDMNSTPILLGLQTCRATDRQPPAPRMRCSNDVLQGLTGASDLACLGLLDSQTSVPPHLRGLATMAQICIMLWRSDNIRESVVYASQIGSNQAWIEGAGAGSGSPPCEMYAYIGTAGRRETMVRVGPIDVVASLVCPCVGGDMLTLGDATMQQHMCNAC
jgi:hypothetical protein